MSSRICTGGEGDGGSESGGDSSDGGAAAAQHRARHHPRRLGASPPAAAAPRRRQGWRQAAARRETPRLRAPGRLPAGQSHLHPGGAVQRRPWGPVRERCGSPGANPGFALPRLGPGLGLVWQTQRFSASRGAEAKPIGARRPMAGWKVATHAGGGGALSLAQTPGTMQPPTLHPHILLSLQHLSAAHGGRPTRLPHGPARLRQDDVRAQRGQGPAAVPPRCRQRERCGGCRRCRRPSLPLPLPAGHTSLPPPPSHPSPRLLHRGSEGGRRAHWL